jgi:cell division protein FtsB
VDYRVNEQTFFEQMRQFLHRNMSILLLAGFALLVVQDLFGTHGVLAMRRAQKQAARLKQEIEQIDTENRRLEDNVKSLKSDPQAIERIAREEMGLARPGEYIFKIPSQPSQPTDSERKLSPAPQENSADGAAER